MTSPRTRFYRDKQNGKIWGICAGIADYTGIDVTLVRLAFVGSVIMTGGGTIPFYVVARFLTPKKPSALYERNRDEQKFWQGVRANPKRTARDVRSRFRELDRRLIDVETYVTSSDNRLAREIEQLR